MIDLFNRLPRYECYKIVRAAPILSFNQSPTGDGADTDNNEPFVLVDLGGDNVMAIPVPVSFFSRGLPVVGDVFVLYADGYKSFSPKKAFEEGYKRLS